MSERLDGWPLVRAFLHMEAGRRGLTQEELADLTGTTRSTLARVAVHGLAERTRYRLEGALDLPRGFLTYIAEGDRENLAAAAPNPDMLRWLVSRMPADAPWPVCPDHREVQYRDGKPPHCGVCGWNRGRPAVPPRRITGGNCG